jgi:hypothetical protein
MYDYSKKLRSMMFDGPKSVHWGELQIDTPEDLPLEMKTKVDRYNNALSRLDVENAEAVADELLEWLGLKTAPAMTT